MVIVNINGGLGNQMFQYAVGRNLAKRLNTQLKFDYSINLTRTDFDPKDIPSMFDIFNCVGEMASLEEIGKFNVPINKSFITKAIFRIINKYRNVIGANYTFIKESCYNYNNDILNLSDNCYLYGYWQSEKYFKDIEDILRIDFKIAKPLNGINLKIAEEIINTESVGIHLRGRDYITKEETKKAHFTCDFQYYERSIALIKTKLKNPVFFVFSDDPKWAKDFLKTDQQMTFVEGNSWNKTNYEDLRLMSLCRHNIIANSSFSWWGAWLNNNAEKIVIAPAKWFSEPERNNQTMDLIPASWIRI